MKVSYRSLPIDQTDVCYEYGPDSVTHPGVPPGNVVEFDWRTSTIYPGTSRKFWVHVPPRYDPSEPASLMVFQDGKYNLDPKGAIRAKTVLDNLHHHGDIPVTITIFVDPGIFEDAEELKNRNEEYDAFDNRYVSFLLTEIIPEVTSRWAITDDPRQWAICGASSAGNCAFTAAWLRPDKFQRVFCSVGSFLQMPSGNPYPQLIVSEPRKPLRIFMHAAHRDIQWNAREDNWLASNLRVAVALAESGYDFRLVLGDGGHNPNHAGVLLPDALRWLWRPTDTNP